MLELNQSSSPQNPFSQLSIEVQSKIQNLYEWIAQNGWSGWDPYDIWDNPLGIWAMSRNNILQKATGVILSQAEYRWPITLRKLLKITPQINPKAMGLFAGSFTELASLKLNSPIHSDTLIQQAGICFEWLESNKITQYGGCGWGYPFDWRTRKLIPKNTPTAVNSAIIGDSYWIDYQLNNNLKALDVCQEICEFFISGLNRSYYKNKGFCFSYTPVDEFEVHNANLFAAEFLIRIGLHTKNNQWVSAGEEAAHFSIAEIREDGTLNYWSEQQSNGILSQDVYHSGYEIRALDSIAFYTGDAQFKKISDKYFETWKNDFFNDGYQPNHLKGSNVIEVHSCAESILCPLQVYKHKQEHNASMLKNEIITNYFSPLFNWINHNLWKQTASQKGYYKYMKREKNLSTDIPFIRWGEAWMFRALSKLHLFINHN